MKPSQAKKGPIKVLVVDDDPLFRDGVKLALQDEPGITVVGEASDGRDAVIQARKLQPDVVTLDVVMSEGDGIEAERRLRRLSPKMKILILTGFSKGYFPRYFQRMKVHGYGCKNEMDGDEIIKAIRAVANKDIYFSDDIAQLVALESIMEPEPPIWSRLSATELAVVMRFIRGETDEKIAEHFFVALKTVSSHRSNILRKLGIKSEVKLFLMALESGLVPSLGF